MKTASQILGLVFLSFSIVGCSFHDYKLSDKGARVRVTDYLSPAERAKLKEVTMISCQLPELPRPLEERAQSCRNGIRNQAAEMGGTVVLFSPEQQFKPDLSSDSGKDGEVCVGCIYMRGIVFTAVP